MGPLPIDSASAGQASSVAGVGTTGSGATGPGSGTANQPAAATPTNSTSTSTTLSVRSQIDTLIASTGSDAQGDQSLRKIIALLILEALLGRGKDESSSKGTELAGLVTGFAGFEQHADVAVFSSTNIVQLQQQSTLVYTDQAIQTTTESGGAAGNGASGARLDVQA